MPTQQETDETYMGVALLHAKRSKSRRTNTGGCLVTSKGVCIPGYNGTPKGMDNNCERLAKEGEFTEGDYGWLVTLPSVIHAELNCILKAAKEGVSIEGATMYITMSPCLHCSAMMIQAGIKEVVFLENYRDTSGLDLLKQAGVKCRQIQL